MTHLRKTLVVAGHGMVGHRFVQAAVERGLTETYDVVVVGEEPRPAYDRVALTSFFSVESADELSLLPEGRYDDPRVRLALGTTVDRAWTARPARCVRRRTARCWRTTRWCWPPARRRSCRRSPGRDLDGCFVYRTIDDLEAIRARAGRARTQRRGRRRRAARPGGGQRAAPARPRDRTSSRWRRG